MGYESSISEKIKKIEHTVTKALIAAGTEIRNEAKAICPADNGILRKDINYDIDTKGEKVLIGNTLQYAIYVNKGTGIHAEDGNGRKTPWTYYSKSKKKFYTTEGQKPNPYLKKALKKSNKKVISITRNILKELDE